MEKNKKLRLLVTTDCHNSCEMCCNKQFDFDTLPVVDRFDYDEVMITGGEPLKDGKLTLKTVNTIKSIRDIWELMGNKDGKIYIYTASEYYFGLVKCVQLVDGIVYTPHNLNELVTLKKFTNYIVKYTVKYNDDSEIHYLESPLLKKSFRLCLFPEIKKLMENTFDDKDFELLNKVWKFKDIVWIKDCPLPEGEDFRRVACL